MKEKKKPRGTDENLESPSGPLNAIMHKWGCDFHVCAGSSIYKYIQWLIQGAATFRGKKRNLTQLVQDT